MSDWVLALIVIELIMVIGWWVGKRIGNVGFIDFLWAYGFSVVAVVYAVLSPAPSFRVWSVLFLVFVWSLRLGTFLLARFYRHYPKEDPRYTKIKAGWKGHTDAKLLGMFLFQGLTISVLSLPFLISLNNTAWF